MLPFVKTLCIVLGLFLIAFEAEWKSVNGFSFDGSAWECNGVNVSAYPKMKEQFESCNKTVNEDFKKKGKSTDGYEVMLCTATCGFLTDGLIDKTSGKLVKDAIKDYKEIFDNIPEEGRRKNITEVFYSCFEDNKDDVVYNATHTHVCTGLMNVGLCIKTRIDAICNPEEEEADDEEDTSESTPAAK